jgi:Tfp pilus assembly protein PilX
MTMTPPLHHSSGCAVPPTPGRVDRQAPGSSRGISLIFSLITLAALSLAAVALIRSVDTGATILGNLSFKQDTALAADEATRQAVAWLADHQVDNSLQADITASGYIASNVLRLDPTGTSSDTTRAVIDWSGGTTCSAYPSGSFSGGCYASGVATAQAGTTPGMANGVSARYLIVRLCEAPGAPLTVSCARPLNASVTQNVERDEIRLGGGARLVTTALSEYFRILVRAEGGRKTVTYTETLVHF